jgi:hypothetical protein
MDAIVRPHGWWEHHHVSTLLAATWSRSPREAISALQHGRVIGFHPTPPVHAVDNTLAETDRVTLCGLDATRMYLWTEIFEDTHPSDRCDACEERAEQWEAARSPAASGS